MKKLFTKKAFMLLCAFFMASALFSQQKRYVFVLGGTNIPQWRSSWVDLRLDDVNRVLYVWPDGSSLSGTTPVGTGSLGQDGYIAFTVGNIGWWGCGYFVLPTSQMDLTDVTEDWTFHFAIRTDCAQDITVGLNGSSPDPSDPFITTKTEGKVILNRTNLPLAQRDKTQWVEFNIPMSQLMSGGSNNLKYLAPLTDQNYLFFSGGNDAGSFIAWDNVYIGAPDGGSGIFTPKAEKLAFSIDDDGNYLNVFNNNSNDEINIYSISGAHVLNSKVNRVNISNLSSGVYIVKSGNLVNKFTKK